MIRADKTTFDQIIKNRAKIHLVLLKDNKERVIAHCQVRHSGYRYDFHDL